MTRMYEVIQILMLYEYTIISKGPESDSDSCLLDMQIYIYTHIFSDLSGFCWNALGVWWSSWHIRVAWKNTIPHSNCCSKMATGLCVIHFDGHFCLPISLDAYHQHITGAGCCSSTVIASCFAVWNYLENGSLVIPFDMILHQLLRGKE